MDPVTLDKLLSIADAIDDRRQGDRITLPAFRALVADLTQAKRLQRRQRDLLRVLKAMRWVTSDDHTVLQLTPCYAAFISAWNEGDLLGVNAGLAEYSPYSHFLTDLKQVMAVKLPRASGNGIQEGLGDVFKGKSLVAFETFRPWATAVGQAYLSPFSEALHWAGDWNDLSPSLNVLEAACADSYRKIEKVSGYANVGRLADTVCRQLHISFQAFEMKLRALLKARPCTLSLAPATIREPTRKYRINVLRSRNDVLRERSAARLRGIGQAPRTQWLEYRYLEDGVRVNGQLLKLIRWEAAK